MACQPCSWFPWQRCPSDRKGELPPTFGQQRNRNMFDIVANILQGAPNTFPTGLLLKRHPWRQLRGDMIKQEKEKKKTQRMSLPARCN